MADNFYLLDCFVSLAMTMLPENWYFLSLRASAAMRGNPIHSARSALTLLFALCALLSDTNGAFVKIVFQMITEIAVRGRIRSFLTAIPN